MAGGSWAGLGGCGDVSKRGVEGMAGEEGADVVHRAGGAERCCCREAGPLIVADMGARAG
jgi:hypothetical protein